MSWTASAATRSSSSCTADLADPSLYAAEELTGHEEDGAPFPVRWASAAEPNPRLYPTALRDLIESLP